MRKCPVCGFNNIDTREACLKCNASLVHRMEFEPTEKDVNRKFRTDYLSSFTRSVSRVGRRIYAILETPVPEGVSYRFPIIAAALGLFPGLGQIYNHQARKAFYFLFILAGLLVPTILFITHPILGNVFPICVILLVMLSFTDALLTAGEINGQTFTLRNKLAMFFVPIFLLGFFATCSAIWIFFGGNEISLFYINYDYMRPALIKGDRVCGEGITYWFRKPAPGDVVHYNPPGYHIEAIEGTYMVDAQNGWERVMAVGGETLECRNYVYYVDGKKLSQSYYPLVTGKLWPNFKVTCPPGHYIVLITTEVEDSGFINVLRGGSTKTPSFAGGEFSVIENGRKKPFENAFIVKRSDIYDRSWFIYRPAERRRFFQARGERFEK